MTHLFACLLTSTCKKTGFVEMVWGSLSQVLNTSSVLVIYVIVMLAVLTSTALAQQWYQNGASEIILLAVFVPYLMSYSIFLMNDYERLVFYFEVPLWNTQMLSSGLHDFEL